jgi:hypothetical protein
MLFFFFFINKIVKLSVEVIFFRYYQSLYTSRSFSIGFSLIGHIVGKFHTQEDTTISYL